MDTASGAVWERAEGGPSAGGRLLGPGLVRCPLGHSALSVCSLEAERGPDWVLASEKICFVQFAGAPHLRGAAQRITLGSGTRECVCAFVCVCAHAGVLAGLFHLSCVLFVAASPRLTG